MSRGIGEKIVNFRRKQETYPVVWAKNREIIQIKISIWKNGGIEVWNIGNSENRTRRTKNNKKPREESSRGNFVAELKIIDLLCKKLLSSNQPSRSKMSPQYVLIMDWA